MGIINRLIIYHRGPTLYVGEWFPNGPNWAYYAWFFETVSICPYLPRWVQGGDFSARGAQPTRALHRDAKSITHRIHVLYIYMVTFTINIPQMSAYIPAPWILWEIMINRTHCQWEWWVPQVLQPRSVSCPFLLLRRRRWILPPWLFGIA